MGLRQGDRLHGFEVLSIDELPEFRAQGLHARHSQTGCQVYHVRSDDNDNLFSFTFKTLPHDDSGVAHILEHSVLCGSRRYPVKDPFLHLLKGSMNTFMNAFTFPDKTSYPASSTVEKDFYNLFTVYGDAVFNPLLRREVFLQEGHRREFGKDGRLQAVGVVYNEMKGNYSTHDSIASEWSYRSLFEGSPYHHDSGGEPEAILDLSYDAFIAYHRRYYHPSNCFVFLYGDIPTERHLAFLQETFLSAFSPAPIEAEPLSVARFTSPRVLEKTYPSGGNDGAKSSVTMNWLLFPVTDTVNSLGFEILSEILLGHAGSPLQRALVESGLGEDLSPSTGLESELSELVFSAGLRGTDPEHRSAVEAVVLDCLRRLESEGIGADNLEGAIRKVEFRNREIRAASGLRLMRRALRGWIHGAGPRETLVFNAALDAVRQRIAREPRYFENLIRACLIDNSHRTTLVVRPDAGQYEREQERYAARMRAEQDALGEERRNVEADGEALRRFQEDADSEDAVARLPSLGLADVPRGVEIIPSETVDVPGFGGCLAHDLFTNGIVYLDLAFDLQGLDPALDMYLPLYCAALGGLGTARRPYDRVALDLSLLTGGVSMQVEAGSPAGRPAELRRHLFVRMKCLEPLLDPALELLGEMLLETDFSPGDRMREVFLEFRNEFKSSVIPSGHQYVSTRVERAFSQAEAAEERWRGITQLLFCSALDDRRDLAALAAAFERIRPALLDRSRLRMNVGCPAAQWPAVLAGLSTLAARLPAGPALSAGGEGTRAVFPAEAREVPGLEAFAIPSPVGYVATALPGQLYGTPQYAQESVLAHLLRTGLLWERIRMKGGAYGAFASSLGMAGVFTLASYRDPNVTETMEAFADTLRELAATGVGETSARNAVIGTAAKETRPLSPGGKSAVAFKRAIYEISDEQRLRHHEAVLDTRAADLRAAAERLVHGLPKAVSAVMAGGQALETATRALPELAANRVDLPL